MALSVLIVDDEKGIPNSIRDYLEDESDYNLAIAFSAEEGLEKLNEAKPDVCIVDMRLPGMTGMEFIKAVHKKLGQCKFIIHTGSMDYSIPQELKAIGVMEDSVLFKPVYDQAIFIEKIKKLTSL